MGLWSRAAAIRLSLPGVDLSALLHSARNPCFLLHVCYLIREIKVSKTSSGRKPLESCRLITKGLTSQSTTRPGHHSLFLIGLWMMLLTPQDQLNSWLTIASLSNNSVTPFAT
ncbi:hypothetical protein AAHE18_17G026400 [Arachis hypogaea]